MNQTKQVDKSHYQFERYMNKGRWNSVWHQVNEVIKLQPERVLEIGPGPGIFKSVAGIFGIVVQTLDLDPDLRPDYVASATAMPLSDKSFDVVCAFQILEHMPFELTLQAVREMTRVSQRFLIISLPDANPVWRYIVHIPMFRTFDFFIPKPQIKKPSHKFDGEHYWELGKEGYDVKDVIHQFECAGVILKKTYRVKENPYHRFFVFEKS